MCSVQRLKGVCVMSQNKLKNITLSRDAELYPWVIWEKQFLRAALGNGLGLNTFSQEKYYEAEALTVITLLLWMWTPHIFGVPN